MAYRNLLTVIPDAAAIDVQLDACMLLARRLDAHLHVLTVGIDDVQVGYYFAGADAVLQQTSMAMANDKAEALLAQVRKRLEPEDIRWTAEAGVAQMGMLADLVAEAAMFTDLVVQALPYGAHGGDGAEAAVEAALFAGRAPVMLVPDAGLPDGFPRHAVIGWNSGLEAMAAVRGALPALQLAGTASVAMVAPPERGPNQTAPGERLSTMLSRHGVKAEIALLAKTHPRVADVLADHVRDQQADLLVTGAYSHSRLREAILGGATRELLSKSPVPLLMAH
jgi:nucleotide-binding universal stress UspA family protein